MAEAVVSITLESISDLIKNEVKFLSGVSDQVQEIHKEFEWMQSFLLDVDARKNQDQRLQTWVKEIRNLAYRAENAIEMYTVEVSSRRGWGFKKVLKRFACILSEARALHKVGAEIANIKDQINRLTRTLQTYGVRATNRGEGTSSGNERQRLLRKTYGHQVQKYFVGMKDDVKHLVSLLTNDDSRHRVISIWGMGGSGKTTIAQKIYNLDDVRRHFDAFAWVCITQECQIQSVVKDILRQLSPNAAMAEGQVVGALYQLQKEKRCLIVLDDIWKLDDWRCLQPAFPDDASCSKTLLTTRIRNVAEVGFLHELRCLKDDEALELLRKKAFPEMDVEDLKSMDPEFEYLGKKMVHKCGNHPLAVSVLGGILSGKNSTRDWEIVNDNMDSYLKRSEQNQEGEGRISQVLALSYSELPYHLKPCFLYLGAFQEDEFIDPEKLYLMWMAEGMVLPKDRLGDESMMDVAERYMEELAHRSMVHVDLADETDLSTRGKFEWCRLHDLMRDLCLEKSKEEEFLQVKLIQEESEDITSLNCNAYRLVIDGGRVERINFNNMETIEKSRQLRSLFFFKDGIVNNEPNLDFNENPFGKFKFLRSLVFEWVSFSDRVAIGLTKEIGKLIHLRLLSFRSCSLRELPSAIGDLPYLQTLDLLNSSIIEIPNVLWKLKRLKHLYFPYPLRFSSSNFMLIKGKEKLRLHGLRELEVLYGFDSDKMEASDLSKLTKLHSFMARVSETKSLSLVINSIEANFRHLKDVHLRIVCDVVAPVEEPNLLRKVLTCRNLYILDIYGYIGSLPNYDSNFLQSLTNLVLGQSHIVEDPMQMLQMLPNLQQLELWDNAYIGKEMSCHSMGFPKLRKLRVSNLDNLERWSIEQRGMASLSELVIVDCKRLQMIPDGLRFIMTLKEFTIHDMPQEFKDRVRLPNGQRGVDFDKVCHIPTLKIW